MDKLDITGLDESTVLAALCNNTKALGLGMMSPKAFDVITAEDCAVEFSAEILKTKSKRISFDYFFGRPIKCAFCFEEGKVLLDFWWLYDRDSDKTAADVIDELRKGAA